MSEFSDAIERLLSAECQPKEVRAIEAGGSCQNLWQSICTTGFPDALVHEAWGGAGLCLSDIFEVLTTCGAYSLPVPLSMTMLTRAVLAENGHDVPEGPIAIAATSSIRDINILCERVPYALSANWVLIANDDNCALMPIELAKAIPTGAHGPLEANLEFSIANVNRNKFPYKADWRATCAAVFAAQMAGAMNRILFDTIRFANERVQFGKSIGKFQAIQQQISVMAEQVFAVRMAAQLGCCSATYWPNPLMAAVAKACASEAVVSVTAFAHAVHGAIGITEEYDLQLFTRRLHEWRLAFGSESYWNRKIGLAVIESRVPSSVDFIREHLSPNPA